MKEAYAQWKALETTFKKGGLVRWLYGGFVDNGKIMREVKMNHCETCKHRAERGTCISGKFREDETGYYSVKEKRDMVIYPYEEGGAFRVGEKFGCIHHEAVGAEKTVDTTAAVNRLLKEIDKLHALLMQVLEEVEKLRDKKSAIELWGDPLSRSEAAIKAQRELLDKAVAGERE